MEHKLADKAVKKSRRNDKKTWIEDKGREAEEAAGKNDSKNGCIESFESSQE